MRIGWGGLGTLAALVLAAASAFGQPAKQPQGKRPPPVEIVSIDLGWHKSIIARDRWQPVTVWVTSRERPFSGMLTVEFPQDHTQKAQVIVGPVATTPGMVTPVEIEIAPYRDAQELVITLTNGRYSTSARYHQQPNSDEVTLPRIGMGQCGLMVFVGRTSASKAVDERSTSILSGELQYNQAAPPPKPDEFSEEAVWNEMIPASVAPDRLPFNWIAYESADVVVCNAADIAGLDARAEAALGKWVESGGRLVVRADQVGPVWPSFLQLDSFKPPVTGTGQLVIEPGEELKALLPRVAVSTFQARLLTLTPEGEARGWTTMFDATRPGHDGPGALVARGPHGLGMVTLIGFDPASVAALIDDEMIKGVWRHVIRPTLPPHSLIGGYPSEGFGMWEPGDMEVTGATNAALDRLAMVPPIGTGMFWLIAAFMLLLVVAIGPFDAKFLKRKRLSQHSWLTAIGWITIASLGAMLAPRLMRSGETVIGRLSAVDTICDVDGSALRTTKHGLTGIFAGRPLSIALEGSRPGAWLRGVSSVQNYWRQDRLGGLPNLTLIPTSSDADVPVRGAWSDQIGVPQWTFRTLADTTPMLPAEPSDVGARVRHTGAEWEIVITNVPQGASVSEAVLRIGKRWHTVSGLATMADNGRDRVLTAPLTGAGTPPPSLARAAPGSSNVWEIPQQGLISLPWVRERGQAIDAMVETGQYACVYLKLLGGPSDLNATGDSQIRQQASSFMRLLTPMPLENQQ